MFDRSFNPRVREGRDVVTRMVAATIDVSIHASVKDATDFFEWARSQGFVSIHASVKDAT